MKLYDFIPVGTIIVDHDECYWRIITPAEANMILGAPMLMDNDPDLVWARRIKPLGKPDDIVVQEFAMADINRIWPLSTLELDWDTLRKDWEAEPLYPRHPNLEIAPQWDERHAATILAMQEKIDAITEAKFNGALQNVETHDTRLMNDPWLTYPAAYPTEGEPWTWIPSPAELAWADTIADEHTKVTRNLPPNIHLTLGVSECDDAEPRALAQKPQPKFGWWG